MKWRAMSAMSLSTALGLVFWLSPNLEPMMLGDNLLVVWFVVFALFWLYLVVQGYPVAHGNIGSSSSHTLDSIVSMTPGLVALFGILVSLAGFWRLSSFEIVVALMTVFVTGYDLWIIGGAASKINRITNEYKAER